ncbi:protein of unknown function [Clostridium cavendishii DSM 21758]|uniref:DUF1540 domain-containing protein n=2 Tax=Clostridium TaxID=1485 RepID=A0A1M6ADG8_9CLOT|nr:protein of unknown function [Clostridium cavendishii DSM 21758]
MKINCSVNNCSHNNSGTCFANRINIGGEGAKNNADTCCASFLSEKTYGSLTNNTNSNSACDALVCKASTCNYNSNNLCTLDSINVSGNGSNLYTETNCESFSS